MSHINTTVKLLVATWILLALLIGGGVGYLLGLRGFGQPTRLGLPPGSLSQPAQNQNNLVPPSNQGVNQPTKSPLPGQPSPQ